MPQLTKKPAPLASWQARQGNGREKAAVLDRQKHSSTGVPIRVGGKIVGEVRNGFFAKRVRASQHMLRIPKAWALDVQSVADAEAAGAMTVRITDIETKRSYEASITLLRSDKAFVFDRGFGRQLALPLEHWRVEDPTGPRQLRLLEVAG